MTPRRPGPPPALAALLEAGGQLARRSTSTRIALARIAAVIDPAAVPVRLRDGMAAELEAARGAACRPLEPRVVHGVLAGAWGRAPGKVLDELGDEPVAVTAAAQVHRAAVDGRPVALKVLRPGLEAVVRNDLVLLDALGPPLRAAFPALDAGALLRASREMALEELDLEHEGANQRQVARALRRTAGVAVPRVDTELTRPEVLVSAFAEGEPLRAGAPPPDPPALARRLLAVHLGIPAALGLVLTDPRPGHVLSAADGTTTLLGTGVARPLQSGRIPIALDALAALRAGDADAFAAAVERLGLLPAGAARAAVPVLRAVAGDLLTGPGRLDADALAGLGERALAALDELLALGARLTPQPEDLAAARMLGQLAALLARLELTEDWVALALRAQHEQALLDPAGDHDA